MLAYDTHQRGYSATPAELTNRLVSSGTSGAAITNRFGPAGGAGIAGLGNALGNFGGQVVDNAMSGRDLISGTSAQEFLTDAGIGMISSRIGGFVGDEFKKPIIKQTTSIAILQTDDATTAIAQSIIDTVLSETPLSIVSSSMVDEFFSNIMKPTAGKVAVQKPLPPKPSPPKYMAPSPQNNKKMIPEWNKKKV